MQDGTASERGAVTSSRERPEEREGRVARFHEVADAIAIADLRTGGFEAFNAAYLIAAREPALVETGSGADGDVLGDALAAAGVDPGDLSHVVVTHIHIDHAGGAGALLRRFPGDPLGPREGRAPPGGPERLVASTARTYGAERMHAFYGETRPVSAGRLRAVTDGDRIDLGDRSLEVLHTPGHASHHVSLLDDRTGAMFTGESIGSHLPWADCYRPALPPPEVDVEMAVAGIERDAGRGPSVLLTSHYGPVTPADEGFDRGAERIRAWSETVRRELETAGRDRGRARALS